MDILLQAQPTIQPGVLEWAGTISSAVIALTAVVGFLLAWRTIVSMRRHREIDFMRHVYEDMHGPLMAARNNTRAINYAQITDLENFPERDDLKRVLNFLETIAIMVRRGHIGKDLVEDMILNVLVETVDDHRLFIEHTRKLDPSLGENLIALANDLRPHKHPRTTKGSEGWIKRLKARIGLG